MLTISYDQIGHRWLDYLLRVEAGETIVVMRDEQPIAEIKPVALRPIGLAKGDFVIPDDFDDPLTLSADTKTDPSESDYDDDWQSKMTQRVQINVSIDELIEPITDIWEDYV